MGKVPAPWEARLPAGRLAKTEGELQSLRGECSNQFAAARAEGELHRWSVLLPSTPEPDMHVCQCWWGLVAGTRASEIRTRRGLGLAVCRQTGVGSGRWNPV